MCLKQKELHELLYSEIRLASDSNNNLIIIQILLYSCIESTYLKTSFHTFLFSSSIFNVSEE